MITVFLRHLKLLNTAFYGLILSVFISGSTTASPTVIILEQAKLAYVDKHTTTPPDFKYSNFVKLDHYWEKEGFYGHAWYQLSFPLVSIETLQTWAIYLPKVNMNAEVWLNGTIIGSGGSMTAPISRHWHSPLIFTVPTKLLNPVGEKVNRIHIHIAAYANRHGNLGKVHIGPEKLLTPTFETEKFHSVTVRIIGSTLIFVLAAILFPIWLKRKNSIYFWFMIACLVWISGSVNTYISNIPMTEPVWEKMIHMILGWVAIAYAFFMVRLTGKRFPVIEKTVLIIMVILNLTIVVIPIEAFFSFVIYYLLFGIIVGISSIMYLTYSWWKEREKSYAIMLVSLIIIALCSIHDLAIQADLWGLNGRYWLDYSIPLVFLMIGYLMVNRFLEAIEESTTLNLELESRVETAQNRIESNYQKIISLETEQAANEERERIYRNLHDDLGSKLLSLVYCSETKTMAGLARAALNDLRHIVSQKPVLNKTLATEIQTWHKECLLRCDESGKLLSFQTNIVPENIMMKNEKLNHLHRLLTEAVTNSIKHAQSKSISIKLHYRLGYLKTTVSDEGKHSSPTQWEEGSGLNNMKYRTERLEGKIYWSSNETGNMVNWIIPLSQQQSNRIK